jgi:hypothetical protein
MLLEHLTGYGADHHSKQIHDIMFDLMATDVPNFIVYLESRFRSCEKELDDVDIGIKIAHKFEKYSHLVLDNQHLLQHKRRKTGANQPSGYSFNSETEQALIKKNKKLEN